MKVLGISGGIKNGNNDAMCKEALMGAKEAGAEIEFISLNELNLDYCTGCTSCVLSLITGGGGKCPLDDDFEWLRDKMMDADGIIWSIPIFEKGATGKFHTIMDRMGPRNDKAVMLDATRLAMQNGGIAPDPRMLKDKVVAYIGIGGSDWTTRIHCDFLIQALTPGWTVIDAVVFSWSKGIMLEDDKVARSHKLGTDLANAAKDIMNAQYVGEPGICPHCHCREFYLNDAADKAICCACGLPGEIRVNGDRKISFYVKPEDRHRAHDTLSGKYIHVNDINEQKAN